MKKQRATRGFTLIELLTVIAIIGILAAMVTVGISRMIEKAKLARMLNTLNQIRNSMVSYYTSNYESFPPGYGYLKQPYSPANALKDQFELKPYMSHIKLFGSFKLYDEFSDRMGYDTNRDSIIQLLEFSPAAQKVGPEQYDFPADFVYNPVLNNQQPLSLPVSSPYEYLGSETRPFVYVAINKAQFKKVWEYYYGLARSGQVDAGMNARVWPANDLGLRFPPSKYDAFALIGVGPVTDTGGVVVNDISVGNPAAAYHIAALRTFFLATRDANGNHKPDFDFSARVEQGKEDAKPDSYVTKNLPGTLCLLPNQDPNQTPMDPKPGPVIYVYGITI